MAEKGIRRVQRSRLIGIATLVAAFACALIVPLASLAGESHDATEGGAAAVAPAQQEAAGGASTQAQMGDLNHDPVKMGAAAEEDDEELARERARVRIALTASKKAAIEQALADQDVTEEDMRAPLPADAIVGVRNIKRVHVDMSVERLIASIGEQARYVGQKEGVPASILIAATIVENGRSGSALSASKDYTAYAAYVESSAKRFAALAGGSKGSSWSSTLSSLQKRDVIGAAESAEFERIIKAYELQAYDKPLAYKIDGTVTDVSTGKRRALEYSDYVNLERIATRYIGTDYVWGGSSEATGFDCSGLVQWTYQKALGITLPRTTYVQQYVGTSVPLDIDRLRMGDLLFFRDSAAGTHHVAMYLADGYYIHAPHSGDVVKISSMDEYPPSFARRVVGFAAAD